MHGPSDVAPATVGVSLLDHGVEVTYLDGRSVLYRGVPDPADGRLRTAPGRETHVLVTAPDGTEGVMVYVNDLTTDDEILEDTGVGRVVLDAGEETELFPGVTVRRVEGNRTVVTADPETVDGRVFVFAEDGWNEDAYELVAPTDDGAAGDGSNDEAGDGSNDGEDRDVAADDADD
ncbi:MAG: DUF5796 family protein [Haloferacaceae archaeon]